MFTKTIIVLAIAMLAATSPFNSLAQDKHAPVNDESAYASVESVISELKNENQKLSDKNAELESRLNQIENDLEQRFMSYNASLSSPEFRESSTADVAKLEQNTPSSFKEKIVIKYYIPSTTTDAYIKIYSVFGSVLLAFPLAEKGFSQVEFSGKTLSAGTFTYMLIVDGKAVDTKNMVLTK